MILGDEHVVYPVFKCGLNKHTMNTTVIAKEFTSNELRYCVWKMMLKGSRDFEEHPASLP